jgi:superfamily I DNA/RNA helicase
VLCFNVTLAARLKSYLAGHGVDDKVQAYHFHAWCAQQLRSFHVDVPHGERPIFERQVEAVIDGVEKGRIPRAQYGAVLIDEAHDFHPEWLRLITGMVDPETNSLLLLYDDAQSIYQKGRLGFSLSSVGIQARGRTRVLKLNYRNTRQILQFAYAFAQAYVQEHDADEDQIPLIKPEAGGGDGAPPVLREFNSTDQESRFIVKCLAHWHANGRSWRDIALVYRSYGTGVRLAKALESASIPFLLTHDKASKASYDPSQDRVSLLTMHSSKGLEFPVVIVAGVGESALDDKELEVEARLLYIAMTRAMESLLVTTCNTNALTGQLVEASKVVAGVRQAPAS